MGNMITAITIENFKGISEPVRLELRPITLLFGQNSAGKSSLLHALIYAREVFERHNLDADRTLAAGDHLDLGGFRTFVHDHDLRKRIRFTFDLDVSERDLPIRAGFATGRNLHPDTKLFVDNISRDSMKCSAHVELAWSTSRDRPYVSVYEISYNGELMGRIRSDDDGRRIEIVELNHRHPLIGPTCDDPSAPSILEQWLEIGAAVLPSTHPIGLIGQTDAMPRFDRSLEIFRTIEEDEIDRVEDPGAFVNLLSEASLHNLSVGHQADVACNSLSVLLELLFLGPGLILQEVLRDFRYLGPTRIVPSRGYAATRSTESSSWANGIAGWDLLYSQPTLVERVSRLLADPQRLNLGYTLEMVEFREFESRDRLLSALQSNTVDDLEDVEGFLKKVITRQRLLFRPIESPGVTLEPADLGVGVSQMIPAVSAALDDQPIGSATVPSPMVAVEHPELNLHPRLQAELADVFLEGALAEATKGRIFFIETHSEVFTLRLFRRVRESHRRQTGPPPGDGRGEGSSAGFGDGTGYGQGDGSGTPGLELTVKPTDVGVWYVDRTTGPVTVKRIAVDVEGELIQPWPESDSLFEQDFRERYG
jgi:predicted ATPase